MALDWMLSDQCSPFVQVTGVYCANLARSPISQYAYVLEMGRIGLERSSLDLLNDDKVKQFYLCG